MLIERDGRVDLDIDGLLLTDAQRRALAIDRHVVVSAGAGSGKTHTLAWRYVRLLLAHASAGGEDIEAVVVLTFTEKAAEEMAERCRARLATVVDAARAAALDVAPRLERLLDRFEHARISTFHAFCAKLLRENPSALDGALDLQVLEPEEALQIRAAAVEQAVDAWTRDHHPDLPLLLDTFGSRRALLEALHIATSASREVQERLGRHARGEVQITYSSSTSDDLRHWMGRVGQPTLAAIAKLTRPGRSPFSATLAPHLRPLPEAPLDLHRRAVDLLSSLMGSSGGLRSLGHHTVVGSKATWPDARRYAAAKAALATLGERCADWPERLEAALDLPTRADERLLEAMVPFATLTAQVRETLVGTHRERGLLDFDRMQDAAVDAVQTDADLRQRLRQRHRWLMVDEFQDTDPRQWAMVRALGDTLAGEVPDRVFLVGDVKQAIYGFRGGEVRLFHEAAAHLGVKPIELPDNFRSRPGLIDWFNHMFPKSLPKDWAPVVAARTDPGAQVVWLEADTVQEEAEAVTGFLASCLEGDRLGDLQTPTQPPVAILLRTRTNLGLWERVLRERGIAYQIAQGVGFWSRPEVVDVVSLAHAVVTEDRLSWVGALRSPLLGAADQAVHDYALSGILPAEGERWRRHARGLATGPWVRWLEDSLSRIGAWAHWDEAARANVRQLLDLAASWDASPLVGVERLLDRVERRPRASEALPSNGPARVVLLTVHASKGLEFPVVVVPELGRRASSRPDPLVVARVDDEWVVAARVDDDDAEIQTRAVPALLHRARRTLRDEADAESARLLYVALTRARDHLVLAGPSEAPARTWAALLADPPDTTQFPTVEGVEREDAEAPAERYRLPPLAAPPQPAEIELVASDLADADTCMASWFRRARLRQPDPARRSAARQRSAVLGTVLHGLIEDRGFGEPALVQRRWTAAAHEAGLAEHDIALGLRELQEHATSVATDARLQAALAAPGFDELAVRAPFPGGLLKGRLDRLYVDRDQGGFIVMDYKTAGSLTDRHALQLAVYGWAAQRILEAHDQPPVVGGLLVSTAGGTHRELPFTADALAAIPGRLAALAGVEGLVHAEHLARRQPERPCEACAFAGTCRATRHEESAPAP